MKSNVYIIMLLLLLACGKSFGQRGAVVLKGRVLNSENEAVADASVLLLNTAFGTKTDLDGNFTFTGIPAGAQALAVSHVAYNTLIHNLTVTPGENAFVVLKLSENRQQLREVSINSTRNGYRVQQSNTSTRMEIPLLETPQSVQVVSTEVMRDRQAFTLNEIAGTFTGMKANNGNGSFNMRGFTAYSPNDASFLLYNGIRGNLFLWSQQPLLYNVEAVELLRGPSGALFSEGAPGGVINFITKKPLAESRYSLNLSYGSWNFRRASADFTGPMSKNKRLLYRTIIGYDRGESFRSGQDKENVFLAPSFTYLFSDKTDLSLELNYAYQKAAHQYDNGTFIRTSPDGTFNFNYYPNSLTVQGPADYGRTDNTSATLTFNHGFSENLKLTVVQRAVRNVLDFTDHIPIGRIRNDSISRGFQDWETDRFSLQTTAYTSYSAQTGPLRHQIMVGADYNRYGWTRNDYQYRQSSRISIFSPDYSNDIPAADAPAEESDDNKRVTNLVGAYVQDQVSLGQKLKALLSLRFDAYDGKETPLSERDNKQGDGLQASGLIPRIGLVYLPLENVSLYGTYLRSFNPQTSNNVLSGGPFPTRKAMQYEVGSKADFFGKRLSATASLYQINYANILTAAPTEENSHRQAAIDGTRSRGGELSLMGTMHNFSLITGYAYNEHVLVSTTSYGNKGDRFANAPKHIANLWLKYDLASTAVKGLGIGAGVRYVSDQVGLLSNQSFVLPEYTVLDAAISYQRQRYNLQANAYNLTNKHYFTGSRSGTTTAGLGDPFNFRIGIGYQLR